MEEQLEYSHLEPAAELVTNTAADQKIESTVPLVATQISFLRISPIMMERRTSQQHFKCSSKVIALDSTTKSAQVPSDPRIPTRPNPLARIPPEIRQVIFCYSGGSAEAVAAFRGDVGTYKDALKVHYECTRFNVPFGFSIKNSPLSKASLNSIKKVRINLVYTVEVWCTALFGPLGAPGATTVTVPIPLDAMDDKGSAANMSTMIDFLQLGVEDIELNLTLRQDFRHLTDGRKAIDIEAEGIKGTWREDFLRRHKSPRLNSYWIILCEVMGAYKVNRLIWEIRRRPSPTTKPTTRMEVRLRKIAVEITWMDDLEYSSILERLDYQFGTNRKVKSVGTGETGIFFWEAERGKVLEWKDLPLNLDW